jgi:hypothetical protein
MRRTKTSSNPETMNPTTSRLSFSHTWAGRSCLVRLAEDLFLDDKAKVESTGNGAFTQLASKDGVAAWMIFTAIHNPELTNIARTLVPSDEVQQTFTFLSEHGCDQALLIDCLVLAFRLTDWVPSLSAEALRNLARDLEDVLIRMRSTVPSHIFLLATPDEKDPNRGVLKQQGTAGDLHVWQELADDLAKKVAGYQELAQLCSLNRVPRMDFLKRVVRLLPLAYVDRKTGQQYYERVSGLLEWAGGQLNRDKRSVDHNKLGAHYRAAKNTPAMNWLEHTIWVLEQTVMSRTLKCEIAGS